jgi:hypothetical protein
VAMSIPESRVIGGISANSVACYSPSQKISRITVFPGPKNCAKAGLPNTNSKDFSVIEIKTDVT